MTPESSRPDRAPARPGELPPASAAVHLVGIGGAGMRGLAVLLAARGYRVSGCDRSGTTALVELERHGVELHEGHDPTHVRGVELVVRSSAVPPGSEELAAAREAVVPVWKRARAMGALVNGGRVLAVTGTHGKTTITAMTGVACEAAGLDPTVLVGGQVVEWEGFARPGGPLAVVEADEYDRSFLTLDPWLVVVSSLEPEHLDTYGTLEALEGAYDEFAGRAAGRGGVLYCADDAGARALGQRHGSELSYGVGREARWRVRIEGREAGRTVCRLRGPEGEVGLALRPPGEHNALNAAAAFAAARLAGADSTAIVAGLERFAGVARRLEVVGAVEPVVVVDDYAHHPTEVAASIDALRAGWPERRLLVVFQPHLYSRTRAFAAEFAAALEAADEAWVLPIYGARETPIEGVTSARIVERSPGRLRETGREEALGRARRALREGPTLIAFMGAGDVTALAREAAARLADAERPSADGIPSERDARSADGTRAAGAEDDAVGA